MLYGLYEWNHAALTPWRAAADMGLNFWKSPANPWAATAGGRAATASLEMFERATRKFAKPVFGLKQAAVDGQTLSINEQVLLQKPFGSLLHFRKAWPAAAKKKAKAQKKLLIVAPMSGHYATLLRGTVEAMLPHFDVHITDWADARTVPMAHGKFDLEDYVDYLIEMLQLLGGDVHVMAVCQPSVPVMVAVSLLNASDDAATPKSMILMGGPIDTRRNPTAVNKLAKEKGVEWFRQNVVMKVPFPHAGFLRDVYPGFLQLTGFMTMNLDRHMDAHRQLFWHLVEGDEDSAERHTEFYDEYMSVMDLTAEFYLQTVNRVFINHDLPKGTYLHRGVKVEPSKITRTALMTIEGERDDISGVGQTEAAHDICTGLSAKQKLHHLQLGVGHYGVFSGSRFRKEVVPMIANFVNAHA
jgi:poly(3-hydroxybutyrate) depolymerase